jgi:succinate dehydrogenase / fumarate reductase cytochrome b subunit
VSASAAVALWSTSIGKKAVMAVTGLILVGFVILHMLGNLKIYLGAAHFDAYAAFLREMGEPLLLPEQALWMVRLVLLAAVALHLIAAVQLTELSRRARPVGYRQAEPVASTYAARTMRWGGVILLLFIVYHLLHFTAGVVGYAPGEFEPGRVHHNVVAGFRVWYVSVFYVAAQLALGLHLFHGVWSSFQTLGLDARGNRFYRQLAIGVAVVVVAGNISIPLAVLAGWIR